MLLDDLHHEVKGPVTLYQDNQGAMAIKNDFISNQRSKHINMKVHFIKEHITSHNIQVAYCPTNMMLADCLTKPMDRQTLKKAKKQLFGTK